MKTLLHSGVEVNFVSHSGNRQHGHLLRPRPPEHRHRRGPGVCQRLL